MGLCHIAAPFFLSKREKRQSYGTKIHLHRRIQHYGVLHKRSTRFENSRPGNQTQCGQDSEMRPWERKATFN